MPGALPIDVSLALKRAKQIFARVDGGRMLLLLPELLSKCVRAPDGVASMRFGGDDGTGPGLLGLAVRLHKPPYDYLTLGVVCCTFDDDPSLAWRELRPWTDARWGRKPHDLLGRLWAWSLDEAPDRMRVTTDVARQLALAIQREGHGLAEAIA